MTLDEIKLQIVAIHKELAAVEPARSAADVYKAVLLRQDLQVWIVKLSQVKVNPFRIVK